MNWKQLSLEAYQNGQMAFRNDFRLYDNPYTCKKLYKAWYSGYAKKLDEWCEIWGR